MAKRVVVCTFDNEENLIAATNAAREQGIAIADAYTPYPVHGMDRAMGLNPSRLSWACFVLGLIGATSIYTFQLWASTASWPINVGGRPWNSTPAFIPATFEMTVLFGGVGTVLLFIIVSGLRPWRVADVPSPRVTDDQFALVLGGQGGPIDRGRVAAVVAPYHPLSVEERDEVAA